jgi:hypothetical protein
MQQDFYISPKNKNLIYHILIEPAEKNSGKYSVSFLFHRRVGKIRTKIV